MKRIQNNRDIPGSPKKKTGKELIRIMISMVVMMVMAVFVYIFNIPNPNMLLITGLAVFTSAFGYGAGVAAGIVMVTYSMYYFSVDHSFTEYTEMNMEKITVVIIGVVLNIICIGHLKSKQERANSRLSQLNQLLVDENLSLEESLNVDTLTGVRNRFAMIRDYIKFADRNVHVMMMDVDDFKHINDHYGHDAGDCVLQETGNLLKDCFGEESSYRYGGDEFTVIMPEIEEKQFVEKLQRFQGEIRELVFRDQMIPVSFSAGYVFGKIVHVGDLKQMLRQADEALYEVKKGGKGSFLGKESKTT